VWAKEEKHSQNSVGKPLGILESKWVDSCQGNWFLEVNCIELLPVGFVISGVKSLLYIIRDSISFLRNGVYSGNHVH
jgi:hypothetical protein